MFQTKKKKILRYLEEKQAKTAFDLLLEDYLSGRLKEQLLALGIRKIEIHIDWLADCRCIVIQGRSGGNYVDIQIEPEAFSLACDPDEPDDHRGYPLESREQFYRTVGQSC